MIEDFVPISETKALITAGRSYHRLKYLVEVRYAFDGTLHLYAPKLLHTGEHIRLGHLFNGEPVFSDGVDKPHQPFRHGEDVYYAYGAPGARIFKNARVFLDHPEGIDQIGKPWVDGETIYFEGHDKATAAPLGWNIFKAGLDGTGVKKICEGANPVIFQGMLYAMIWLNGCFHVFRRAAFLVAQLAMQFSLIA